MEQTTRTHNLSKRLLGLLLAAVMCLSVMPMHDLHITANATSKTVDQAISWLESNIGKKIGSGQCVALIVAYYNFLGVSPASGNGSDYTWNALPSGWSRIAGATPQPGDVLVYYSGNTGYGHVGVMGKNGQHYHQNVNKVQYVQKIIPDGTGWNPTYNGFLDPPYYGVIRPNFSTSPDAEKNIKRFNETAKSVDAYYKLASGKTSAVVRLSPYNGGDSNKVGTLTSGEIHVTKSGKNTENHIWYYIGDGQFAGCYIYSENVTKVTGCTHNYQEHYEADHPHRVYKKCTKCGNYYYTGATKYLSTCSECNPPVSNWFDDGTGFYAYIFKKDSWKALENSGGNVQLAQNGNDGYDPRQIWLFNRQSDLSYEIVNMYDGTCLDAYCHGTDPGTNVGTYTKNDQPAQRWFLRLTSNDDVNIIPSYCDLALDVSGNENNPGTNVMLWDYIGDCKTVR